MIFVIDDEFRLGLVEQDLHSMRDAPKESVKRLVIWAFIERDLRFGLLGWQPIKL